MMTAAHAIELTHIMLSRTKFGPKSPKTSEFPPQNMLFLLLAAPPAAGTAHGGTAGRPTRPRRGPNNTPLDGAPPEPPLAALASQLAAAEPSPPSCGERRMRRVALADAKPAAGRKRPKRTRSGPARVWGTQTTCPFGAFFFLSPKTSEFCSMRTCQFAATSCVMQRALVHPREKKRAHLRACKQCKKTNKVNGHSGK